MTTRESDAPQGKFELGEFDLIAHTFAPLATTPGAFGLLDDAAVFDVPPGESCVVTTDAMVSGVHFFANDGGLSVGWKLLAVNLSDLAAMGAAPLGYTLDLALPKGFSMDWIAQFARGLGECQARFATSLLGGDTVSTSGPLTLAVTAFGSAPKGKVLRRAGARAGDQIWVSGTIGDAALAVKARQGWLPLGGGALGFADARLDRPEPRLALGRALRGIATAAADISDGLVADLGHICTASGTGAHIRFADVPLSVEMQGLLQATPDLVSTILMGGDDYELVFTAAPGSESAIRAASTTASCAVACIGEMTAGSGVQVVGLDGRPIVLDRLGFTHF